GARGRRRAPRRPRGPSCATSSARAARRGNYHRPAVDDRLAVHLELARLSDEEFVRRAYRLVLRREPEPEALERRVPRATLLRELVSSEEFGRLAALDEALSAGRDTFLEAPPGTDERTIEIPWALARVRRDN